MTNREAIILLQQHKLIHDITESRKWENVNKAMEMGIQALEKQEPKKPIIKWHDATGDDIRCLVCNGECNWNDNYCPKCGQAIDWSE